MKSMNMSTHCFSVFFFNQEEPEFQVSQHKWTDIQAKSFYFATGLTRTEEYSMTMFIYRALGETQGQIQSQLKASENPGEREPGVK